MKTTSALTLIKRAALLLLLSALSPQPSAFAQTNAFTYQGRLTENGAAANSTNDFNFTLYDAASGGGMLAFNLVNDLAITNGLFTVTLDFGSSLFDGSARWLQIAVRPGTSAGAYTNLDPRQRITVTPYAIRALSAGTAGSAAIASSVAASAVTSAGLAPGSVGATAIADGSITSADLNPSLLNNTFWKLTGNEVVPGQFLGSTNNQPVEIRANGFRALRLEPRGSGSAPNLVGGYHNNTAGNFSGVAIAGGGTQGSVNQVAGDYAFIGAGHGGYPGHFAAVVGGAYNTSLGQFSFVGTGQGNTNLGLYAAIVAGSSNSITALADHAFIGGGQNNTANNTHATIGGGEINRASSWATVGGGRGNLGDGGYATVGGGRANSSSGTYATVPGGLSNVAEGESSFAAGQRAKANHRGSFVWADSQNADFASVANNQFLIRAAGNVGINKPNPATTLDVNGGVRARGGAPGAFGVNNNGYAFSGNGGDDDGGMFSSANGQVEFYGNSLERMRITDTGNVGIGTTAPASALHVNGTVTATSFSGNGAGLANVNADTLGGVSGSTFWKIGGNAVGATPGGNVIGTTDNQSLELRVNGIRGFRLQPGTVSPHVVGGGFSSVAAGLNGVTIGGGQENNVSSTYSVIGGGLRNSVGSGGQDSTIGGGQLNAIATNTVAATVAGGTLNTIGAGSQYAAIGGGSFNLILDGGVQSTIGGGRNNFIDVNSRAATIAGGTTNSIGGNSFGATIGGGHDNHATGSYSTIGGGELNTSAGPWATVSGGALNTSSGTESTVGGGVQNTSSGPHATVGGGLQNTSSGQQATVGGGEQNTSSDTGATVGGGLQNTSAGPWATVSGGAQNTSGGNYATVPGGLLNTAGGGLSFAAGHRAKAIHEGSFVWADAQNADFESTGNNQFAVRANGGVRFATQPAINELAALDQVAIGPNGTPNAALRLGFHGYNGITSAGLIQATDGGPVPLRLNPFGGGVSVGGTLAVNGVVSASSDAIEAFEVSGTAAGYALRDRVTGGAGRWVMFATSGTLGFYGAGNTRLSVTSAGAVTATSFNPTSDRHAKQDFEEVNCRAVLEKVAQLPIQSWTFKNDPNTKHVGPMAQDFHAAFNVGMDDKHIATVDADGVALAAIQGLNQKVEGEVTSLRAENAGLKQRLEKLEQLMNRQNGGAK